MWSFDVFFYVSLNQQDSGFWFEAPWCSYDVTVTFPWRLPMPTFHVAFLPRPASLLAQKATNTNTTHATFHILDLQQGTQRRYMGAGGWGECMYTGNMCDTNVTLNDGDPGESNMMTSSNGNLFRVTGPLWGEFTGHRWIPLTKASDAELGCFLWSAPEQKVVQIIETQVIWDATVLIMTS